MKEYFAPEKHLLYEEKSLFPEWQKKELEKVIGKDEANRFEKNFTKHTIYKRMALRLDLLLDEKLQSRLDDLKKEILG